MRSWPYTYTPAIWPPLLTAVFLLALAIYGWRRRHVPGATPFVISCAFSFAWAIGLVLQAAATQPATTLFWFHFGSAWSLPALTAVTCFILEYTWPGRWLTRRTLLLLCAVPALFVLLMATNGSHHLIFRTVADGATLTNTYGPAAVYFVIYGYALGLVNVAVLVWLFVRSPQHRWLAVLLIFVQIVSRLLFALELAGVEQLRLPFDAPVFAVPYLAYAVALFAFHIFDPVAMAHLTAVAQLDVGVLTLDRLGRAIDLNPAAARILGLPAERVKGRPVGELLPTPAAAPPGDDGAAGLALSLGEPPHRRDYAVTASPLRDWRGLDVGRVLLLYDVTEQKRAAAQREEHQRALATLQERERLARELHDSAGQLFGYVGLQAQAIHKHLRDGNLAVAEDQLARLADVAAAAHTDVRASILSLKTGAAPPLGFLAALGQYLTAYEKNYGVHAALVVADGLSDGDFAPDTTAQLLRVVTEALTNARKHGRPGAVRVELARDGGAARITIADDGCGFAGGDGGGPSGPLGSTSGPLGSTSGPLGSASGPLGSPSGHFGLAFMRERMAEIGGRLVVDSLPGAGTRVILDVPLRAAQEVSG